jgi:AraC-like DNA-binding protein
MRDRAVHIGTREHVRAHATQAFKLVVGVDCQVEVTRGSARSSHRAVLVAPYEVQAMGGEGTMVAFFVEPGAHGFPYRAEPLSVPSARTTEALVRVAREIALGRVADDAQASLEGLALTRCGGRDRLDARVASALRALASTPSESIDAVARTQRLSSSRLRHLVHAETGLSLRAHRLWHRTLFAVEHVLAGDGIARAAAAAGFSDHAHLTRTFVRFFGRTPSGIPGGVGMLGSWAERL